MSIDHALAISYRRNAYDSRASTFVGHISLVKGVPFFGYHVGYKFFLKIYMLNPLHMTRFADLLQQGAILKQAIQPYESHMQYLAQWMCDYNLYGCGYIDCKKAMFRGPLPEYLELNSLAHRWHDRSVDEEWISNPDLLPKQSHCSLEVDVRVEDILNRLEIHERPLHHDFVERSIESRPEDKFVASMAGLWRDETKRRKRRMGIKDPSSSPFPPEVLVSMSVDSRNPQSGGWIHEDEYRGTIKELIEAERQGSRTRNVGFDDFVQPARLEDQVQSALDSVEDLFSSKFLPEDALSSNATIKTATSDDALNAQELVDEGNISLNDMDDIESDEEIAKEIALSQLQSCLNENMNGNLNHQQENHFATSPRPLKKRRMTSSNVANEMKKSPLKRVAFQSPPDKVGSFGQSLPSSQDRILQKSSFEQLSQGSIKAHGSGAPSTMSFPAVKNPNDPETVLRLSQRTEFSNSQKEPNSAENYDSFGSGPRNPWMAAIPSFSNNSGQSLSLSYTSSRVRKLASNLHSARERQYTLLLARLPPSAEEVESSMLEHGLPPVIYQGAYYSDERDVPDRPREYAGREFKLESNTVPFLPIFDPTGNSLASCGQKLPCAADKTKKDLPERRRRGQCSLKNWQFAALPPSYAEVDSWLVKETAERLLEDRCDRLIPNAIQKGLAETGVSIAPQSQIDGPTQKNKHGFKFFQKARSTSVLHETQYMSIMSLEVHANSRGSLAPDPAEDALAAVFWCIKADDDAQGGDRLKQGIIVLSGEEGIAAQVSKQTSVTVEHEMDELDLINRMVDIVREYDPDVLTGYEVHNGSWGYLIERARLKYEYDLCDEFSRMKSQSHGRFGKDADRWGFTRTSTIRVTGRHMINIWRAMRGELNLLQYTLENVAFHLLHKRVPHYSFADLTRWFQGDKSRDLSKVLTYFLTRIQLNLQILEANEIIPRTSEQARLLGVDFFSVFSRGSQFKVESLMFRIAKPENFILVSPSRKQVGQQNALECLPLVMEPQSAFYNSPLLVLDFQSLYPSIMIAYNYCYSTFLGRVVTWRGQNKMGFTDFQREPGLLELVKDHINIAPNGIMYVRPELRKSLLAKMLGEVLETRVMVKSGMKVDKDDKILQQLLHNRQLALKFIANVTYGYTSASFSGRMPCAEIADSIVQTGRETLEKAIALIHSVEKWGAEVVYGDTDSLFVYLKGRSRDEAFKIGDEIAKSVTKANPRPVKLKFEKVYHPCVLLAKKRYVGFKYESPTQTEPEFDAKGIETVRRDGTPAEQKIEEKALKLLFRSQDLSEVKKYFQKQCHKIMTGRVSIQDFLFAKEVKLGTYSEKGPAPPGALIATRRMLADRRLEPQYGERVPYVVTTGAPGARLVDRCVDPESLLRDEGGELALDAEYYIGKNLIPPLERIFNLVGANVRGWYDEMPKVQRVRNVAPPALSDSFAPGVGAIKKTLESYMKSSACLLCRDRLPLVKASVSTCELPLPLCEACARQAPATLLELKSRLRNAETRVSHVDDVCRSCSGLAFGEEIKCDSRDCPVFYTRLREKAKTRRMKDVTEPVIRALEHRSKSELEW